MSDIDNSADYRAAGFGARIGFGSTPAVLVVDLVQAYFDPASPLYSPLYHGVDKACLSLVEAGRGAGIPVIFTNVKYHAGGKDGGHFYRKVPSLELLYEGSVYGEFLDHVKPAEGEVVVTKQYASGFFGTSLGSTLTSLGVDTVLICGVSTSGCVRATATDALQNGFRSIVVREAVGDRSKEINEANLFDLNAKYADVITLAQTVSYLGNLGG